MSDKWLGFVLKCFIIQGSLCNTIRRHCESGIKESRSRIKNNDERQQRTSGRARKSSSAPPRRPRGPERRPSSGRDQARRSSCSTHNTKQAASSNCRSPVEVPELLLRVEPMAERHFNLVVNLFYALFVTHMLVNILTFESLAPYRILDCFLIGRFRLPGRSSKLSSVLAPIVALTFYSYRIFFNYDRMRLFNVFGSKRDADESLLDQQRLKFHAIEFLLNDYGEVLSYQVRYAESQPDLSTSAALAALTGNSKEQLADGGGGGGGGGFLIDAMATKERVRLASGWRPDEAGWNSLFYIHRPRTSKTSIYESEWILRPNRTAGNWFRLARFTKIFFLICLGAYLPIFLAEFYSTISAFLTISGYELSYASCVKQILITRNRTKQSDFFSSLYQGPLGAVFNSSKPLRAYDIHSDAVPFVLPFENFVAPTLYHMVRIFFDISFTFLFLFDAYWMSASQVYVVFLLTYDVILNAKEIRHRMSLTIEQYYRYQEQPKVSFQHQYGDHELHKPELDWRDDSSGLFGQARVPSRRRQLESSRLEQSVNYTAEFLIEIYRLQAILQDHLALIKEYNDYTSLYIFTVTTFWFPYTAIMFAWVLRSNSRAIELEFIIFELICIFFVLMLLACASLARTYNYKIYKLLTNAMALDYNYSATKIRWVLLTKCYHPKSLFCFTLLNTAEVSWLFCLKFASWCISALSLLTNFLYGRRA